MFTHEAVIVALAVRPLNQEIFLFLQNQFAKSEGDKMQLCLPFVWPSAYI